MVKDHILWNTIIKSNTLLYKDEQIDKSIHIRIFDAQSVTVTPMLTPGEVVLSSGRAAASSRRGSAEVGIEFLQRH